MRNDTRTRGVTVEIVDLSDIYTKALEKRQADDPTVTSCDSGYTWAKATAPNGITYMICSEGVGYPVTDEEPVKIDLYDKSEVDGKKTFSIVPNLVASIDPETLATLPVTGEADLADFVRVFGDRLETNFRIWHDNLTAAEIPDEVEPADELSSFQRWMPTEYAADPPEYNCPYFQATYGEYKGQVWRGDDDAVWNWHVVRGDSDSSPERADTHRDRAAAIALCRQALIEVHDQEQNRPLTAAEATAMFAAIDHGRAMRGER